MLEAVSEPPLMQRQFPSIHFSLVSLNEERNIRRGSRATPLRHPLLHTLLLFSRLTNFSSSPTSTSSLESNSNFRKFKDSENLLLPNNWERWAFIFVYIRNEASPTFFEFAGRTAFATGVFLFRALNFRAVRRHARRGWPGCKIKTEQRYVKFLRGRTTSRRRKPWQNTSLPSLPLLFRRFAFITRHFGSLQRQTGERGARPLSTASPRRWAAASASRGVTRNVTRFGRHNYARGARIPTVTRTARETERERGGAPQNIHSSRQKYWPPPPRDAWTPCQFE